MGQTIIIITIYFSFFLLFVTSTLGEVYPNYYFHLMNYNFFVYILTNFNKTVLYIGVTNDLFTRLKQHKADSLGLKRSFAGKYNCVYLLWYERHGDINHAIEREKEIKKWSRVKKESLINEINPQWNFLNQEV